MTDDLVALKATIEALIFASPEPVTLKTLTKILDDEPPEHVTEALAELTQEWNRGGGLQLIEVAGRISDRHASGAQRVGPSTLSRALEPTPVGAGARDVGRRRLPTASHGARDRRDPGRQHVRGTGDAPGASFGQSGRSKTGRRPAVSLRYNPRVSRPFRPKRLGGPAQGRGYGRGLGFGRAAWVGGASADGRRPSV